MAIADLGIVGRFRVYDMNLCQYIFSYLDCSAPGDIPPDIAVLPVLGTRLYDGVLYIDTMTKGE